MPYQEREFSLGEIAQRFGLTLRGDAEARVSGPCSLSRSRSGRLTYLEDAKFLRHLPGTQATAVILPPALAEQCPTNALLAENPRLAYARVATLWNRHDQPQTPGIHPSAIVDTRAELDAGVHIGPGSIVQEGARIGRNVYIGPGCIVGRDVEIGDDSYLLANVTIYDGVRIGQRVHMDIHSMLGARGFGLAQDGERWVEIPQLGTVQVGDDTEIGALASIERGAIEDTVIGEGVKVDGHVHIAHNCSIGAHTAIAGCVGIAGSVTLGRHCILGGGVGIADHITITDNVVILGMSMVTHDITRPGVYSAGWSAQPAAEWRRQVAGLRRLEELRRRVRELETMTRKSGDTT